MARKSNKALQMHRADEFARLEAQVQRAGLVVLTMFLVLGAAGLFGNGPLSRVQSTTGNLTVEYERFTRQTTLHEIVVEAATGGIPEARISFDKSFLDQYVIEETRPRQAKTEDHGDRLTFLVPTIDGMARLALRLEASNPGLFSTRVSLEGGSSSEIRQLVFF